MDCGLPRRASVSAIVEMPDFSCSSLPVSVCAPCAAQPAKSRPRVAIKNRFTRGSWRCVELLLPVSGPNARSSDALWRAAKHGHGRVVQLLAPVSDTSGWERWMWRELDSNVVRLVSSACSTNCKRPQLNAKHRVPL